MTTWTTFETIDESSQRSEFALRDFYVDHLGMCQFGSKDNRTRFQIVRGTQPTSLRTDWVVWDLTAEDGQKDAYEGTMRECVQWMSARVLYGA